MPREAEAVRRAADGAGVFEHAEGDIDLWTAGSEQQGELALRESELKRHSPSGRGLSISERDEEESRQTNFHRVERNRLEPIAGVPEPPAQE